MQYVYFVSFYLSNVDWGNGTWGNGNMTTNRPWDEATAVEFQSRFSTPVTVVFFQLIRTIGDQFSTEGEAS